MVGGMCTQEEQIYFTNLVPNLVLLEGSKQGLLSLRQRAVNEGSGTWLPFWDL